MITTTFRCTGVRADIKFVSIISSLQVLVGNCFIVSVQLNFFCAGFSERHLSYCRLAFYFLSLKLCRNNEKNMNAVCFFWNLGDDFFSDACGTHSVK